MSNSYTGTNENGTEEEPYKSLSGALGSIWGIQVKVSLLKGTHDFASIIYATYEDAFASNSATSPLSSSVNKNINKLTITSFLCTDALNNSPYHANIAGNCINDPNTERPVISLTEKLMQLILTSNTLISNIDFTAEK